jgi:NACHT domain
MMQAQLDRLIEKCHAASTELRNILFKIATDDVIKDNNVYLVLRIRKVREFWKQPEIDRLLAKLDEYQKQLVNETLACVSTRLSALDLENGVALGNDYRSHGKIVEILAVAEDFLDLPKRAKGQTRQEVSEILVNKDATSSHQSETAMAAVVTFLNGETKFLTRAGTRTHYHPSKQQILMTLRDTNLVATIDNFRYIQDLVLDSLYFRQCHERLKTVRAAHQETYEWIFCPPEANKPWAPFVEWLEHGNGCYYISGKPGSGKSTLIKFVAQHKRTKAALEKWAGGTPVGASFFFWNLGSPLQKSSIGLLRGLLYDLLTQQRSLISVVMPDLWHSATQLAAGSNLGELSMEELKRWIRKLLAEETTSLKFFIIIDGIDEFEGDHDDLVELISDVVKNKNVKVLLSSRPTTLSEDSFKACPMLRLQDLTRGDIQKYAGDHLSGRLKQKHGARWAALIAEITDRSHGVFLWVVLVIQSLREGLIEGDSIKEMDDRLNELPRDLKALYDHMIRNLRLRYQRQASEMFQLLLKAQQVQSSAGYPLLIQLSFCDDDPEQIVSLPTRPLDTGSYNENCEQFSNRIRSRSRGLIESREWQTNRISGVDQTIVSSTYVDFIHRTVVEFLRLPEVWEDLITLTATPKKYDPSPQLFRSCVIMCKTLPTPRGIDTEISTLWHMMDRGLVYASMAEDSGEPVALEHLKQLDAVLTMHWAGTMKCFSRKGSCDMQGHWARGYTVDPQRQHVLNPDNFASVALFHGLEHYLINEIANSASVAVMDTTRLLFDSLRYIGAPPWDTQPAEFNGSLTSEAAMFLDREVVIRPRWVNVAIHLLQAEGTDPNKPIVGSTSAWSLMLSYIAAASGTQRAKQIFHRDLAPEGFANLFAKLLDEFIKQGADLHLCRAAGAEPAWKLVEQLFSEEGSSSQRLDPWARQPAVPINTNVTTMRDYFRHLVVERKL